MVRAAFVYLAVALVAVAEGASVHWEIIPASLLVSVLVIPSILGFLVVEQYLGQRRWAKHIPFIMALVPLSALLVSGLAGPTEGREMSLLVGFWYSSQTITAYLLLVLPRGRAPGQGANVLRMEVRLRHRS